LRDGNNEAMSPLLCMVGGPYTPQVPCWDRTVVYIPCPPASQCVQPCSSRCTWPVPARYTLTDCSVQQRWRSFCVRLGT